MALDFSSLKRNSSLNNSSIVKKAQEQTSGSFEKDERYWTCEQDKSGTGEAIIRFLPAPKGEDFPWVKYFRHSFKGPSGKWYIENSLTTFNQPDPLAELNSKEWDDNDETAKNRIRPRSRKQTFVSNIYVVQDKANPENEGKVFLFRYGKNIFDMINSAMNPEFETDTPIVPFDFWEGANFKLRIIKKDGFPSYEKSIFMEQSPLFDDDEKIEQVWNQQYSLQEILDPKNFKSYEELKKRLSLVMAKPKSQDDNEEEETEEKEEAIPTNKVSVKADAEKPSLKENFGKPKVPYGETADDDDEIPDYFSNLKNKKS